MISNQRRMRPLRPLRGRGRFVRERDVAITSMLGARPMAGETLEVEVRPDISILWQGEIPLAACLGASVLVRRGGDRQAHRAIEEAASAAGLLLEPMGEQRLWALLGPA